MEITNFIIIIIKLFKHEQQRYLQILPKVVELSAFLFKTLYSYSLSVISTLLNTSRNGAPSLCFKRFIKHLVY